MIPQNPLQPLHDLDRTSPQFHELLLDFLRGNEYQTSVPTLQGENLAWLVEYLDSVSVQTTSPHSALRGGAGPRRHFRSREPRLPGIPT